MSSTGREIEAMPIGTASIFFSLMPYLLLLLLLYKQIVNITSASLPMG